MAETKVFLQWKGTDACFDFTCECGYSAHFDGEFAYILHCNGCGAYWEMPYDLFPKKIDSPHTSVVVEMESNDPLEGLDV